MPVDLAVTRDLNHISTYPVMGETDPNQKKSHGDRSAAVPESNAEAGQRVGNYIKIELLGAGGMGSVYLAQHHRFKHRQYAIKFVKVGGESADTLARFEREIEVQGQLDHENLVAAIDAGMMEDAPYLVMEYVDGEDVNRVLQSRGRLSVADSAEIIRQACMGLEQAHQKQIFHRDIKPSNLMLRRDGVVKVTDLGLAIVSEASQLTNDQGMLGTAAFASPEQWQNPHAVDARGDIYSLGCTLYCLLTGRPPFRSRGKSLPQMMLAHLSESPAMVNVLRQEVPEQLALILHECLEKDPSRRIQSVRTLAERLQPFCHGAQLDLLVEEVNSAPSAELIGETIAPSMHSTDSLEADAAPAAEADSVLEWSHNQQNQEPASPLVWWTIGLLLCVSTVSLWWSYYGPGTTLAWQTRFDQLGNPEKFPRGTGFLIELGRSLLVITIPCYLAGTRFRRQIRNFFNWKKSNLVVWFSRILVIGLTGLFIAAESNRQLDVAKAPTTLNNWAVERGIESTPAMEAPPYRAYLAYSLVNYLIAFGVLLACPILSFAFSDIAYMNRKLRQFQDRQLLSADTGQAVNNLRRFAAQCRQLTGNYVAVVGVLSIGIHYEYWIGKWTLTDAGMQTAALGWIVVGMTSLLVVVVSHVYNQGFATTGQLITERGSIEQELQLRQFDVLWWLKTAIVYQIGGLAFASLIIVGIHAAIT
jgi:serine/threonine protein kinase